MKGKTKPMNAGRSKMYESINPMETTTISTINSIFCSKTSAIAMPPDNIATAKYKLKKPSLRQKDKSAGFVANTMDIKPTTECEIFDCSLSLSINSIM
jgi:hypothetical protein